MRMSAERVRRRMRGREIREEGRVLRGLVVGVSIGDGGGWDDWFGRMMVAALSSGVGDGWEIWFMGRVERGK